MAVLKFSIDDVRRLVKHAKAAKTHGLNYGTQTGPGLWLVHDDGVYLMSNGLPRDIVSGDQEHGLSFTAHAKGMNPKRDGHQAFERARDAVGGDDFSEFIALDTFEQILNHELVPHFRYITVRLGVESLTVGLAR